jgi:uncharacterized protein YodC (DUF2158 family)
MTKHTIEVNKIGTKVKLTEDVYATIIGINITGDTDIVYKCAWWNGRSYVTEYFSPNQIEVTLVEKTKIGFA